MGPDGLRPPGDAFYYQSAYVVCLLVLIGITWLLSKFMKQRRLHLAGLCSAFFLAIMGAVTLREEYRISRIEIAHRFMSRIQDGEFTFPTALRGVDGVSVHATRDGEIYSTFGNLQETEAKLRKKYDHWFSGSIVKIRKAILPTTGCTLSSEGAPSDEK
jgi:hypothetical protein